MRLLLKTSGRTRIQDNNQNLILKFEKAISKQKSDYSGHISNGPIHTNEMKSRVIIKTETAARLSLLSEEFRGKSYVRYSAGSACQRCNAVTTRHCSVAPTGSDDCSFNAAWVQDHSLSSAHLVDRYRDWCSLEVMA